MLQCSAPREKDFTYAIDREIEKVNNFADGLRKDLLKRFESAQKQHDALTAGGSDEADLQALREQLAECSGGLYDFEGFININYLAFSKILKKHDKMSSCPCRAPYLLRIQRETFARQCLPGAHQGFRSARISRGDGVAAGYVEMTEAEAVWMRRRAGTASSAQGWDRSSRRASSGLPPPTSSK